MKVYKKVFFISTLCGVAFACMLLLSENSNSKSECMQSYFFHMLNVYTHALTHTLTLVIKTQLLLQSVLTFSMYSLAAWFNT